MSVKQSVLVSLFLLLSVFLPGAYTDKYLYAEENIYLNYQTEVIGEVQLNDGEFLSIERAYKYEGNERVKWHSFIDYFNWISYILGDNYWNTAPIQRVQFRKSSGEIVAYTPTRYSFALSCLEENRCWVFMWKTIYPLPAIFKLNTDRQTWGEGNVVLPLQYASSGGAMEGVTEIVNPVLGGGWLGKTVYK
ncbi:MAG: hypothetical protein ACRBDL_11235 [Alphaproteobacteria bacterium]